jgi:hypothetical protein
MPLFPDDEKEAKKSAACVKTGFSQIAEVHCAAKNQQNSSPLAPQTLLILYAALQI